MNRLSIKAVARARGGDRVIADGRSMQRSCHPRIESGAGSEQREGSRRIDEILRVAQDDRRYVITAAQRGNGGAIEDIAKR